MYKIIGADGKEYGPITTEQLRQWIAEGRVNAQTKILAEGTTEWRTVSDFPEFAAAAPGTPTPSTPGPIPTIQPAGIPAASDAAAKVSGPAIGLIITAILGLLANLVGLLWQMVGGRAAGPPPGMNPQMEQFFKVYTTFGMVSSVIAVALAVLILLGALKMKKLESYGFAMTASIVAMIPCISPCCLLGLPIGIWSLVVLAKPEVKSAFH
jgi:hypothetical protein